MQKRVITLLVLFTLLLSACGPMSYQEISGSSEEAASVSIDNISEESSKEAQIESLETKSSDDVATMIGNTFNLLDTVAGEAATASIYATRHFEAQELASLVADLKQPEEISEFKDGRQILVYDDYFVTFKQADEDASATIIEVASDEFVENNYSPNYFNGFFTFLLLNRMLGTNNWSNNRMERCRNTQCYGGYSTNRSYNNNGRGMSNYRGGGPGSGK